MFSPANDSKVKQLKEDDQLKVLTPEEVEIVSGGSCPLTNGDNPFVKQTMQVYAAVVRGWLGTCP